MRVLARHAELQHSVAALVEVTATILPTALTTETALVEARQVLWGFSAATALQQRGFQTTLIEDADVRTMDAAIRLFSAVVVGAEIALIYLAGHAVERHGAGYFLSSDFLFPLSPSKAMQRGISLNDLIRTTQSAKSGIVVLDACRNWPADPDEQLKISNDIDQLVEEERTWRNVLLAYSTSASTAASDGVDGAGSLFCQAFCRYILDHSLNIDECFRLIAQEVMVWRLLYVPGVLVMIVGVGVVWLLRQTTDLDGTFPKVDGTHGAEIERRSRWHRRIYSGKLRTFIRRYAPYEKPPPQ